MGVRPVPWDVPDPSQRRQGPGGDKALERGSVGAWKREAWTRLRPTSARQGVEALGRRGLGRGGQIIVRSLPPLHAQWRRAPRIGERHDRCQSGPRTVPVRSGTGSTQTLEFQSPVNRPRDAVLTPSPPRGKGRGEVSDPSLAPYVRSVQSIRFPPKTSEKPLDETPLKAHRSLS